MTRSGASKVPDTEHAAGEVDPLAMRRTMGRFATGVAVVTSVGRDGEPHGMTVNSLTSVSLDPPLLLVCFTSGARTADAVVESGRFAVSILGAAQEHIARRFATRAADHFEELHLHTGDHAVPVVPGATAQLECVVDRHLLAGDHVVVIGQVVRARDRDGRPLAFHEGRFVDVVDRDSEPVPWFF